MLRFGLVEELNYEKNPDFYDFFGSNSRFCLSG